MITYYGDFPEDHTHILIPFNTFTSDDPSASSTITDLADADIKVHKDGSTDEIVTDGATVAINFDGITGNHLVTIDSSVDAAYATGSEYQVRIEGTTVDGATINAWVGSFSIERAGGTIALLKLIQAAVITNAAGTDVAADIIAVKAETATIVNDTDVIDDGTSGLVKIASDVADILVDTGSTLDALIKDVPTVAEFEARTDVAGTACTPTEAETACDNALVSVNLDHLMKTVVADRDVMAEVVDGTVLANIMTKTDGDTSDFDPDTDSLEAIKDEITAVKTVTDVESGVKAAVDALENISAANVNTEVKDVLDTDTHGEPATGAPGATISIEEKISWLYALFRNKTLTTATLLTLRNDADNADIAKATLSDDATTFTKAEFVSG